MPCFLHFGDQSFVKRSNALKKYKNIQNWKNIEIMYLE